MMKRYGPWILGILAILLLVISGLRWIRGEGLDVFSLVISAAALTLLVFRMIQTGED